LIEKKNILLLFILCLRHHDFSSKCAYGEKIYFSLFVSVLVTLQQQFTFCLCCHLVLYQFELSRFFSQKTNIFLKKSTFFPKNRIFSQKLDFFSQKIGKIENVSSTIPQCPQKCRFFLKEPD
jgi:hypothetical protein